MSSYQMRVRRVEQGSSPVPPPKITSVIIDVTGNGHDGFMECCDKTIRAVQLRVKVSDMISCADCRHELTITHVDLEKPLGIVLVKRA